ncbi:glycogen synthase GlgA [Billgrantia aerodenitrificans]|uniref:Glycogen synthase n=1 Tax=Billgrantia aerodenitrificans TaxID=2733483 RepID=A0ABS9ARJ0_9GAMM|nr:glycogen synthase GlgA [Halomonas aerodenitrificans]MCE8024218.1 glycogen synthase GlgA [Halomonas aerodenitrificans]
MGNVALKGIDSDTKAVPRSRAFTARLEEFRLDDTSKTGRDAALPRARGEGRHPSQRILFATPEIADFVKVGGLGDVSSALPRALAAHHDIRILMPAYREVRNSALNIRRVGHLPAHAELPACELGEMTCADGMVIYVLLCPELYERDGGPYGTGPGGYGSGGWEDNDIRFARLSLAAAQIAAGQAGLDWQPQLLHLNDWTCGLAPAYLEWMGRQVPSVFTIHNLAYQGLFDRSRCTALGIPDSAFHIEGVEYYGRLSFMKAGIVYASHVTTVSATYAQEITTPEFGCGLEGLLCCKAQQGRLSGIPNGIDDSWDPRTDAHLVQAFSSNDWRGKRANADYVRHRFGLAPSAGPLFAMVSRMVHQKGVDLVIDAAPSIVQAGGQLVFIGSGERRVEEQLDRLAERYPGAVAAYIGFDEYEARCIYAGSDFLLMPSRFEPCGLSQMYAQRFGSLPIAHRTGGLADTIEDGVTGFLFEGANLASFMLAIQQAFSVYHSTELFYAMRRAAMTGRYHWRQSIAPYTQLYRRICNEAGVEVRQAG